MTHTHTVRPTVRSTRKPATTRGRLLPTIATGDEKQRSSLDDAAAPFPFDERRGCSGGAATRTNRLPSSNAMDSVLFSFLPFFPTDSVYSGFLCFPIEQVS